MAVVHVINYDSEFKLIVLSPTCAALIMQAASDTFLALLGFANILSRTNM